MALTVQTVRTAISTNTAGQNTYAFSPSSNATAGATLVLVVTADNSASGGSSNNISGVTDSKNNTWSAIRQAPLYDNGAASAGIQGGWFDTNQDVGTLTTSDTITVAFSGTTTVARAVVVYQITPEAGMTVAYVTGGVGTGASAANGQITTGTVEIGQVVFAAYHSENVNAVTGDSDTTNGSWSSQETTTVGTGITGIRHASQYKIQTTAASTQSYDVTVSSQDRIVSYVQYKQYGLKSFTADAWIAKTVSGSVTANATSLKTFSGSLTADALRLKTIAGSVTANADIAGGMVTQQGSIDSDAVFHRLQAGSLNADAIALLTQSGQFSADAIQLFTATGALSADAIALLTQSGQFSADAIGLLTSQGLFTVDAIRLKTVAFGITSEATFGVPTNTVYADFDADAIKTLVGACIWTYPIDGEPITATPEMRFLMPYAANELYFWLEMDKVDTFDSVNLRQYKTTDDLAGWSYWDGGTWQGVPADGVANTYAGNEARLIVSDPLMGGTWYRRVRAGTR